MKVLNIGNLICVKCGTAALLTERNVEIIIAKHMGLGDCEDKGREFTISWFTI